MKRATQFTLFATGLMLTVMLMLYGFLVADVQDFLESIGAIAYLSDFLGVRHIVLFAAAGLIALTLSSVIIDKVLNPLRLMIEKVKEVSDMNFEKPLVIDENDDELKEYVFAFNNMTGKLNRYIEMQKRFVSDASHELATPITVINGHADMLLRRGKDNPELLENSLETIKSEIMRMSGLVDSLLLLARSDSNRQAYNFEQTDITKLIHDAMDEIKLVAPDYIIEETLPEHLSARCDEYAIRRVMRIILTNAVRYAENGRHITIKAEEGHGLVLVSVKDNGIGIPPHAIPRVFERFYRVDSSRNKKTGSSGLGLAIAKEIINAHGGEIEAFSKLGEGTEIRFRISS